MKIAFRGSRKQNITASLAPQFAIEVNLTLSQRQAITELKLEKCRVWFCSDRRQNSVENRNAARGMNIQHRDKDREHAHKAKTSSMDIQQ